MTGGASAPGLPQRSRTAPVSLSATSALALLALWLLATLGLRPLLMPDEGRYANIAREMLTASLWVPTLNGLPFFHKPPLFYWLDMAAMQGLGVNAFAARAGAVVGAWLMGASLFLGARHWHGPRVATIALVALATSPFFFVGAQYANHDLLVAGLISAAVLAFARALEEPPRVHLRWLVLAWVACAVAMLAKGLIGFVLPALVIGPWMLAQRRWSQLPRLFHPLAVLAGLAVAAPWFIAIQLRFPGFFDYFFMEQHVRRFAQSSFNNLQPFWFFLLVLPLLTLPWSLWLPAALRGAWRQRSPMTSLWCWWVLVIVGFFSLPSSKLVGYVMPALVPWSIVLAQMLERSKPRHLNRMAAGAAVVCLSIVATLAWRAPHGNRALAAVLAARLGPGDRVVMVDQAFYDVSFYAALAEPPVIASDWADPRLPSQDNWRKELADAGRFDPELARRVLQPLTSLPRLACGQGTVWFVVADAKSAALQGVPGATPVFERGGTQLWRAPMPACAAAVALP